MKDPLWEPHVCPRQFLQHSLVFRLRSGAAQRFASCKPLRRFGVRQLKATTRKRSLSAPVKSAVDSFR